MWGIGNSVGRGGLSALKARNGTSKHNFSSCIYDWQFRCGLKPAMDSTLSLVAWRWPDGTDLCLWAQPLSWHLLCMQERHTAL